MTSFDKINNNNNNNTNSSVFISPLFYSYKTFRGLNIVKINDLNNNLLTVFTEISRALVVKLLVCKCLSLGLDECSEILLYWRL